MKRPSSASWRGACGQIVLVLCLCSGAVSAQSDFLPEDIRTLEAAGDLERARKRLGELTPTADTKADLDAHRALLDNTIQLLRVADVYAQHGLGQQAVSALKAFLPKVSTPRDASLAVRVQRRINELQVQPAAERAALDALIRADTLFARGLYKRAKDEYAAVVKQGDTISRAAKARAERGVVKASQEEFDAEPFGVVATVHRSLGDAAAALSAWLLTGAVLLPFVALLWGGRRLWLTNTRSLELVDLTVLTPSPSANRELRQQLEDVLERIRASSAGTARLEAIGSSEPASDGDGELPPPDLVFVTPTVDVPELAAELEKFVAATPAIQVGPIGLNPQQLWSFTRRFFRPRSRHAFAGSLTTYDNSIILRLTREDRRLGTRVEWRASAPSGSSAARMTCLVDVACRIILDGRTVPTVTSDCGSLKAYVLGLYALSGPETLAALATAAAHFQDALDLDEENWLARFQLALAERGQKHTREAIHHLTWFEGPDAAQIPSLHDHIARHADFPYVVRYHLASTLAMQGDARDDARVGGMLDELIGLETNEAGQALDHRSRQRLVMLARSAQSTREAVRISQLHDDGSRPEEIGRARELLRRHMDWFDTHAQELERMAHAGHALARGIVLHAYGRIQYASGNRNGAVDRLTEAVDLLPDYADVHVDLAKAYLERKRETNWPQRVTSLLDRALALDSQNAKARFVYARFYFSEGTRDFAKAEPYLTAAPFDPTSLFMHAQILSTRGQHKEALDVLERAIALQPDGPTFRIRLYAESLHALVKADPTARGLEHARQQLCRYDSRFKPDDKDNKNYLRVVALYRDICTLMNVETADEKCFQADAKG